MATYTVHLDFGAALEPPHRCPGCGHPGLRVVLAADVPLFRCPECAGCWRIVLGRFVPVNAADDCQAR